MYDIGVAAGHAGVSIGEAANLLRLFDCEIHNQAGRREISAGSFLVLLTYDALKTARVRQPEMIIKAFAGKIRKAGEDYDKLTDARREEVRGFDILVVADGEVASLGEGESYDLIHGAWIKRIPCPAIVISISLLELWRRFRPTP